jgi:hypothetical protein
MNPAVKKVARFLPSFAVIKHCWMPRARWASVSDHDAHLRAQPTGEARPRGREYLVVDVG